MASYKAIIEGSDREVLGWTSAGTLALADGEEIAMAPLDPDQPTGKIWRIARLKLENEDWLMDGKSLSSLKQSALERAHNLAPTTKPREEELHEYQTLDVLIDILNNDFSGMASAIQVVSQRHARREKLKRVVAVAWSADRTDRTSDRPGGFYIPILLTRFDFIVNTMVNTAATGHSNARPSEYVIGIKEAAKYLGKSERTIRSWIRREWLRADRPGGQGKNPGKLIRFKRTDLDNCRKQN
jgi:excisionase family DNA binding protein